MVNVTTLGTARLSGVQCLYSFLGMLLFHLITLKALVTTWTLLEQLNVNREEVEGMEEEIQGAHFQAVVPDLLIYLLLDWLALFSMETPMLWTPRQPTW
jgi:hypothetical protein